MALPFANYNLSNPYIILQKLGLLYFQNTFFTSFQESIYKVFYDLSPMQLLKSINIFYKIATVCGLDDTIENLSFNSFRFSSTQEPTGFTLNAGGALTYLCICFFIYNIVAFLYGKNQYIALKAVTAPFS